MDKNIIIIGAGGFAREVLVYVQDCIKAGKNWKIEGFLDDNLNALDNYNYDIKIIGKISEYKPKQNDRFILAIANPLLKKKFTENLLERNFIFETLIHPTALIGNNVKIGTGCIFAPFSIATCDCQIGNFVTVNCSSGFGHNSKCGDFSTLSASCDVTGFVELGEGVFMGSRSTIHPKRKIGNWAKIGLGSGVVTNVKDGKSVIGVPAMPI